MVKHSIRCSVCKKFITFEDALDDSMCESCACKIEAIASARSTTLRRVLYALAVFWIITALVLLNCCTSHAFQEEYFVSGTNLTTGERVIGWLDGTLGEPEVQGYILDRGDHYAVTGTFSGKGSFSLRSLCCTYDVEVTDEISPSKIENARRNK